MCPEVSSETKETTWILTTGELIKETEREVKSDVLGAEEWRAERGLASQSRKGASMPQPSDVRARDSWWWPVTLICTYCSKFGNKQDPEAIKAPTTSISLTSTCDSSKKKARIATLPYQQEMGLFQLWGKIPCGRQEKAHEEKAQGRGEGAYLPGGKVTSFPRSPNGKFSSYNFPCWILMLLCLTLSFNWPSLGWDRSRTSPG